VQVAVQAGVAAAGQVADLHDNGRWWKGRCGRWQQVMPPWDFE
jgi:hypothetical protein